MFKIIQKTIRTGIVTKAYPAELAHISEHFRGRPHFDFEKWADARPAAEVCPTGAISLRDSNDSREVTVETDAEIVGQKARETIHKVLGRSLAIREVDAGSCNGCEVEIVALNNPIHDIERFGIQFVASPRHADMLLVTGPVTRNMELALLKTYRAMPEPKVVVAVGACGISGGIFGENYASLGGVDKVLPVDVYIPGCPPRPQALLHGILLAVGRLRERLYDESAGGS